jgi:hypothetical protein
MEKVNGFVHITCSNCNKTKWLIQSNFTKMNNISNYYFCEKGCEISYELRNQYIKLKKYNEENMLKRKSDNIILIGTISS